MTVAAREARKRLSELIRRTVERIGLPFLHPNGKLSWLYSGYEAIPLKAFSERPGSRVPGFPFRFLTNP